MTLKKTLSTVLTTAVGSAMALPATAEGWSAQATLSAPLDGEYRLAGDQVEMWADGFGDLFFNATAYLGPDDRNGTACAQANMIKFDVFYGYSGRMELQFLFDAVPASPGQWRAVEPSGFYNAGTRDDSFLVNIELWDGADLTLTSMKCQPDGTVDVAFGYEFTGGSDTGKGPQNLTVTGTTDITGIALLSYDEY